MNDSFNNQKLIITDEKSTLIAQPLGDAEVAVKMEGRSYYHSNFQPTGRYVKKGGVLKITVSMSVSSLEVAIGLYGEYASQNGGKSISHAKFKLSPGDNIVVAPVDGMVYIQNRISSERVMVEIHGGQPVPTYIKGVTTRAEFDQQLEKWGTAPFVELIGEYILGDFQSTMAIPELKKPIDIERRMNMLDSVVAYTNGLYGLSRNATDAGHKSSHRIYISNPDTGPGAASATNYRITFQIAGGAGRKLLTGAENDQWAFYHEVGHTYQMKEFNWKGQGEVTVNISSLAVQEAMGFPNYLDGVATTNKVKAYREIPIAERNFATISDVWLRLMMFDQLRRGFGNNFYARLTQIFRTENALALAESVDDFAVQQHFILTAAKLTGRNLAPFFDDWGVKMDDTTRVALAKFTALQKPILNNLNRATDVLELNLAAFEVSSLLTSPAEGVVFGVDHAPVYAGKGVPGATITIEQGLRTGSWGRVGTTLVDDFGNWSFVGQKLSAGAREARATQNNLSSSFARNTFTVAAMVDVPVTLTSPVVGTSFDENHVPVYAGQGIPGATVTIEQGLASTGTRYVVGTPLIDTNGDWAFIGEKLSPGEWETRVVQSQRDVSSSTILFVVTKSPSVPVTLTAPAAGAMFDVNYVPTYRGKGTPGSTITVEQMLLSGSWSAVGSAMVNAFSDWSLVGQILPVGQREARATQNSDGTHSNRHAFTVVEKIQVPVTLEFPANKEVFYENHRPVYSGKGTPGATVSVEEGLLTSPWNQVGNARVDMNGEWSYIGYKVTAGAREVRVIQTDGGTGTIRRPFTVAKVPQVPVTLASPNEDAPFGVNHLPLYSGTGTPGAMVTLSQGLRTGVWSAVGTTLVNDAGDWSFIGKRLKVGQRETLAVQQINDDITSARRPFTVTG